MDHSDNDIDNIFDIGSNHNNNNNNNNNETTIIDDENNVFDGSIYESIPIGRDVILMSMVFRLAAFISVVCAICLAMETFSLIRADRNNTLITYRILFVIALCHLMSFIASTVGSSAAPKGSFMAWGAIGNEITCQMQGFIFYCFFTCGIFWDAILSWTYVAMVKYNWPSWRLRRIYRLGHVIIWPIGIIIGILPIPFDAYIFLYQSCIVMAPFDCEGSECEQTRKFVYIIQSVVTDLVLVAIGFSILCMILLYLHVLHLERKNQQYYSGMLARTNRMQRSRKVGIQGILYASTFIVAYVPLLVVSTTANPGKVSFIFQLLTSAVFNLFSLWNLLLFMREREMMQTSLGRFLRRILCHHCCLIACLPCKRVFTLFCCRTATTSDSNNIEQIAAAASHASVVEQIHQISKWKSNNNINACEVDQTKELTKEFGSGEVFATKEFKIGNVGPTSRTGQGEHSAETFSDEV